jgi:hypothetical protein
MSVVDAKEGCAAIQFRVRSMLQCNTLCQMITHKLM